MSSCLAQTKQPLFVNLGSALHKALSCAATLAAGLTAAQAQISISSADMFNQAGQYYRAYANNPSNTLPVSSVLGTPGGPQAWDFSTGPQDVIYRFNYISASQGSNGVDFVNAGAQIAEQKFDEAHASTPSFLYFKQDPVRGRLDYGFYDPSFSPAQPESIFDTPLQDFPNSIHYGTTWSGTTVFYSTLSDPMFGDVPDQLTYTANDTVDAYGLVTLPNLGFLECLRIHESVEYDIAVDLGDGYQHIATQYTLNYYWVAPGHGIVVQITSTSPSDGSRPPDDMPGGAAALVRMFALNHPTSGTNTPNTIKGFKITLGQSAALLQWTLLNGVSSYRVDYATDLRGTPNWQPLGTTSSNFLLDPAAVTPAAPRRYYRVVGTVGP